MRAPLPPESRARIRACSQSRWSDAARRMSSGLCEDVRRSEESLNIFAYTHVGHFKPSILLRRYRRFIPTNFLGTSELGMWLVVCKHDILRLAIFRKNLSTHPYETVVSGTEVEEDALASSSSTSSFIFQIVPEIRRKEQVVITCEYVCCRMLRDRSLFFANMWLDIGRVKNR